MVIRKELIDMKLRDKNDITKDLIQELEKTGYEKKAPVWRTVAKALNKSRRKRIEVNVYDIEKNAKKGETIIVPGVVLSNGDMKKALNVAALRFTPTAKAKIERAGGKCMHIEDLLKAHATGKGAKIRILG
ncbi:MAG: 50S ribosomal protein L18e [Nanoarchaeota archaeon]|nr:50S ribosomal protein L18e [Nanoarchaeota archaeon]MBU1135501.1 50S ribosomal protein L18e [Nanoarchaeota archaeon]MBU2520146.1 50S ribosomal protein L18e [Nanoarchaeota archaeon]